jgi:hypothetical protein
MKTYGEVDVYVHVFLTLALVRCEWSAFHLVGFTPGERASGRMGAPQSQSGLTGIVKILDRWQDSDPSIVQGVASCYTDWATYVLRQNCCLRSNCYS